MESSIAPRPDVRAVSVTEAARLLGLSRATAYRLVREGDLRAVRLRTVWRVPIDAIDAILATSRTNPS